MIFLLIFVCGNVLFNQCLRYGQKHGANILAAVSVNYAIAALVSTGIYLGRGLQFSQLLDPHVLAIAGVNGVFYFIHILIVLAAYRVVGVGITAALTRAGVILPSVVAWFAWSEAMTPYRWIALGLVPVAMVLMRRHETTQAHFTLKGDMVLLASFAMAGVILTIHKYAEVHFDLDQREAYKTLLFLVASLSSLGYAAVKRVRYSRHDIALGVVIGLTNATMLFVVLVCLARMPAVVFYPTSASLDICLNVIVSRFAWNEKLLKRQLAGVALAIGVVLLTNL
jgi:drug/metabolite transporter (DMT)-like permease